MSTTIPQRTDIDERYTWRLSDIYPDDSAWNVDYDRVTKLLGEAPGYSGRATESASTLWEILELSSEVSQLLGRLYQYAYLNKDLDNRESKYQEMVRRVTQLSTQVAAAFSWLEPELLKQDDDTLRSLAQQFPDNDRYDFYIEELIRSKAHVRSEEVEEVLATAGLMSTGPEQIFSLLDDADIDYPTIKDADGHDLKLTKQRYAKLMESPHREVRERAHVGFYEPYNDLRNTIGAALAASVNGDLFFVRTRRYESSLHRALHGDNIPEAVYRGLIEATEKNLDGLHRYMALRARVLKIDAVRPWDLYNPLFPDADYTVPYDTAVASVIAACEPLGDRYVRRLRDAFESRWVDVYETQGKGGGAYSFGNYNTHPYVLMNYNDSVDNMFTLAHEMGHAMHSTLSNETQSYQKASYSLFVAEVASTLNEALLMEKLIAEADSDRTRMYLLNKQLQDTLGTFFNQVMYAHFELAIHEEVENGGALSPDAMTKLWGDMNDQYYGPSYDGDDLAPLKWARVPHFYRAYYVFQYATSFSASAAIMTMIADGDSQAVERYLTLLAAGGRDHPIELLRHCGVDMETPAPVEATLATFAGGVDELERLVDAHENGG